MTPTVRTFRAFAVGSAVLAYALAVLGSWVRINEAGMSCPDWPLCHGALVPSFAGGVIWEWLHRLVALVEGLLLIGVLISGWRVRGRIAGVGPALALLVAIFVAQVAVGGATVHLGNSPNSVVLHWGIAMALLATLTVLAVLSVLAPAPAVRAPRADGSLAMALGIAAFAAFVTMCIGAYVSSSHAGLACSSFPSCDGSLLGQTAAQLAQMVHRFGAGTFFIVAVIATWQAVRGGTAPVVRFALAGLLLTVLQIGLGIANVLLGMPILLREAHAGNAGLTFLTYVIAATLATIGANAVSRDFRAVPQYTRAPGG
jgi:heme A synthase